MTPRGRGAILLTGASASVKGFALSAAFAMGKFALRGLAQSAARELGPKGTRVATSSSTVQCAAQRGRTRKTKPWTLTPLHKAIWTSCASGAVPGRWKSSFAPG